MALGPVLRYELITTSRRPRYYLARFLYGLLLLGILYQQSDRRQTLYPNQVLDSQTEMRYFAESVFATIGGAQAMVLLFITPALVAGVIADEARRKTLYDLFSSGLSSRSIVLGKLSARLVHAFALVAIGVPVVAILELLGGLDPWIVFYVYVGTFTTIFAVGSLSMLVSVVARSPREANLISYALLIAWVAGPPFAKPIFEQFLSGPLSYLLVLNEKVRASNPMWIGTWLQGWANQFERSVYWSSNGTTFRWTTPPRVLAADEFHWMLGLQAGIGLAALILSILLLRPVRGFGDGSGTIRWKHYLGKRFNERVRTSRVIFTRSSCGNVPMLWKERRATHRGGIAWLAGRPLGLVVAIIMGCFLFEASLPAFREMTDTFNLGNANRSRQYLNGMIRDMATYVFTLWMVIVACAGAVSVTEEKESDTWISLTATLLTAKEIIMGKIFGAIWSAHWISLALLAMIGLGVIAGALHPLGALLSVLGLVVYGIFAASLGIAISLRTKTSPRALFLTIVVLALINMVGPLTASVMRIQGFEPIFLTSMTPYVERVALYSHEDFNPTNLNRPAILENLMPIKSSLTVISASFILYGVSAWLLTVRSIRAFDRAVDRPRRSLIAMPPPGEIRGTLERIP